MNKSLTLVGGLGLGAALMYIFDPDRGKRRRAMIREKVESAGNKAGDKASKMGQNLRNRASGMIAETRSMFRAEEVSDEVLADRVRARLGRIPAHIEALEVSALNGEVTLRGQISAENLPKVLRAVRFVRGVKSVDNQFDVSAESRNASVLPGEPQPLGAR